MRILTVRQPWAWAIIHGGKDIENRVRNIAGSYRGQVAIHSGLTRDDQGWVDSGAYYRTRTMQDVNGWGAGTTGRILGVVDLVDVHPVANPHFHPICHDLTRPDGLREAAERGDGACSPWAMPDGQWHLVLKNPRALVEPIPYKGALGLRELPEDVAATVRGLL